MSPSSEARYWIEQLALIPHPEGGYYRETYRSSEQIDDACLPERKQLQDGVVLAITLTGGNGFKRPRPAIGHSELPFVARRTDREINRTIDLTDPRAAVACTAAFGDRLEPDFVVAAHPGFGATRGEAHFVLREMALNALPFRDETGFWRQGGRIHRTLVRMHGAESDYYLSLPIPYQAKDGLFHALEELLLVRGVTVSLGTDANNRLNLYDEMRAAEYLQRVTRLEMGVVPGAVPDSRGTALPLFEMGTSGGARNMGLETGRIAPGLWADLVALDLGDPSLLPGALAGGDDLLNAIVYSMVAQTAVRHSWVGGRQLVVDGRLAGVSREEVREMVARVARV